MAGNIKQFDAMMPTLTGRETTAQLAKIVMSFVYELTQQLQYQLSNLDSSNFNTQSLSDLQLDTTREIRETIKNDIVPKLQQMQTDMDALTDSVTDVDKLAKQNQQDIKKAVKDIATNTQNIANLLKMIVPGSEGGGTIGKEGQRLDLVGEIYMNGKPYKPNGG